MDHKKSPNEQKADGTMDKAKGRVKEAAGALTNDPKLRAEGQVDQVKGAAKEKTGEIRDKARKNI